MIFSIVIPTRDRLELLEEALASVVAQHCTDWELIVIDDGSINPIASMLGTGISNDHRFTCLRNDPSRGVSYSRNMGIEAARGDWLLFLDDDDTLEPNYLQSAWQTISNGSEQGVIMPAAMHPHSKKSTWSYHRMKTQVLHNRQIKERNAQYFHLLIDAPPQIPTLICRRDVINDLRFLEGISYGEDLLFWASLLRLNHTFRTQSAGNDNRALIRHHGTSQLSASGQKAMSRYFELLTENYGPLDTQTTQSVLVKRLLGSIKQRQWRQAGGEWTLGIKKPRHFLGSMSYQLKLNVQTIIRYLLYRVGNIDS